MTHHPLMKQSRVTTEVRLVFDASAQGYNGVSLNNCMYTGLSLIPISIEVPLRFPRRNVALSAGFTKAFLQVLVCGKDRDAYTDPCGTTRVE